MTYNNTTIKSLETIARNQVAVSPAATRATKEAVLEQYLNTSKFAFIGFIDRTTEVVLRQRFHNYRDAKGRFTTVKRAR